MYALQTGDPINIGCGCGRTHVGEWISGTCTKKHALVTACRQACQQPHGMLQHNAKNALPLLLLLLLLWCVQG